MKKSNVTLRGIVVAGDSRQEAEDNYRAVATGVSVKALQDKDNEFVILSNADSELTLMNPLSGDMNLVEASDLQNDHFEFLASDSDETVTTHYTLCASGCGSHIIADDTELMERCPVCASTLEDLSADDIEEALNAEASDEEEEDFDEEVEASDDSNEGVSTPLLVVAGSYNDAVEAFRSIASGEADTEGYDCGGLTIVADADSDIQYSPYNAEEAVASDAPEDFSVEASANGDYAAHWYMCASDECGVHVVASDDEPVFCPVCASGLIEPDEEDQQDDEVTASAEDDEEDYEAELEDVALAGDDEDEEEDEPDDEDDDDEDDEEDDDEDEDFDDENSMSVSSVTVEDDEEDFKGEASAEHGEAAASAASEPTPLESVSTDLLALASAQGELSVDQLEVAFAGDIAGESTWVAFHGGKPVATVTASGTSAQSEVFNSNVFSNLVHASASEQGVSAALEELGFKPIEASVEVDSYVQNEVASRVEAGVSDVRSNFEKSSSDHAARFEAALATAATGINKGFFDNVNNPVKGALVATMSSLGIRNPERVVASAFAKHNEQYLRNLVAKANEIMDYDVEVQNQLTKAVASTAEEQVATASAGEGEHLPIGKPVTSAKPSARPQEDAPSQEATASAGPNLDAVLGTLGRRR